MKCMITARSARHKCHKQKYKAKCNILTTVLTNLWSFESFSFHGSTAHKIKSMKKVLKLLTVLQRIFAAQKDPQTKDIKGGKGEGGGAKGGRGGGGGGKVPWKKAAFNRFYIKQIKKIS